MDMKRLWSRTVCAVLLTGAGPSAQADYTFTQIDVPGATHGTDAYGINDAGQIMGIFSNATGDHSFLAMPTAAVP